MDNRRKQYERHKVPSYPIMFNTAAYVVECRLSEMSSSIEVKDKCQGLSNTYFSIALFHNFLRNGEFKKNRGSFFMAGHF